MATDPTEGFGAAGDRETQTSDARVIFLDARSAGFTKHESVHLRFCFWLCGRSEAAAATTRFPVAAFIILFDVNDGRIARECKEQRAGVDVELEPRYHQFKHHH